MGIKEKYSIKQIDKKVANNIQIENHYLHTKASCIYGFGLFEGDDVILYRTYEYITLTLICKYLLVKKSLFIRVVIYDNRPAIRVIYRSNT